MLLERALDPQTSLWWGALALGHQLERAVRVHVEPGPFTPARGLAQVLCTLDKAGWVDGGTGRPSGALSLGHHRRYILQPDNELHPITRGTCMGLYPNHPVITRWM